MLSAIIILGGTLSHADTVDFAADTDRTSYKVPFPGPGDLESWLISLELRRPNSESQLTELRVALTRGGAIVKEIVYSRSAIEGLIPEGYEDEDEFYVDLLFHEPASLKTDRVRLEYGFSSENNHDRGALEIETKVYGQKNDYIFPLMGKSILTAGYFNSGGHLGLATLFAVDAVGLTESLSPLVSLAEEKNTDMAGWGREIIAPSDGTVVFVETGIADQPYGIYDEESFAIGEGNYAYWGNAVVIDHGNDEYGVIMHMRAGSVAVAVGESVEQGQVIGLLGNSGDSFGPHIHFHVQTEPVPLDGQGLPVSFTDVSSRYLRKGEWIDRK